MWNEAILIGNLGRDPEVRSMNSGGKVCLLSLATTEKWKDKASGEAKERTEWHRVVCFGKPAEIAERYCHKGTLVSVRGSIRTRMYAQDGMNKYSTEIVVDGFDSRFKILKDGKDARPSTGSPYKDGPHATKGSDADLDDAIPF